MVEGGNMTDTQTKLFEVGTVCSVSTSGWQGKDKLRAADLGVDEENVLDIFTLGSKRIIPHEWKVKMTSAPSKVTALMSRIARPFILKGSWFVANNRILVAKEGLENISQEQQAIVTDFVNHYEEIQRDMIREYPTLENANWPTEDQIRQKFKVTALWFQMSQTEVSSVDPADLIAANQEFQQNLKQAYDEYVREILREAHVAIVDVCEEINEKILETGDKITETTLKKPKNIIETYMAVARHFDLDEIHAEIQKVKDLMDVKAKDLRDDYSVAHNFATNLREIGDNIGDLSGYNTEGRLRRKVKRVANG